MSGRPVVWLVLFDIDGTLVSCGLQIRDIFAASLEATFGTTGPLESYSFAGRTDDGIVHDLMAAAGLPEEQVAATLPRFRTRYLDRLDADLDAEQMRLLPGVREMLDRLAARDDVGIGLLTGNWERGARIKLSRFDLNRYFAFGAFGDGRRSRDELPPVALRRAREAARIEVEAAETLIVGDSVLDVGCARAHGIPSLAVATGFTPADELRAAGADWVVSSLLAVDGCHPALVAARPTQGRL